MRTGRDVLPSIRGAHGVDALLRVIYGTTRAPLCAVGKSVVHVAAAWERDDLSLVSCLLNSARCGSVSSACLDLTDPFVTAMRAPGSDQHRCGCRASKRA